MSSVSQGDGLIEVTRGTKKRKASTSPTLPNLPKLGSPLGIPVRPKPYRNHTIPVITSGVDEKFKSWRKLTGELRQYHLSLKISMIKELCNYIAKRKQSEGCSRQKTLRSVSQKPFKPAKNRQKLLQLKDCQLI